MADSYTRLYAHVVFAVKSRQRLIPHDRKEDLHRYITGILKNKGHTVIAINSMPDHIHILFGYRGHHALSTIVRDVKANSSRFVNEQGWTRFRFEWQDGYGGFSYGPTTLDVVARYVRNQERHHRKDSYLDEYRRELQAFDITFNGRYLVDWEKDEEGESGISK